MASSSSSSSVASFSNEQILFCKQVLKEEYYKVDEALFELSISKGTHEVGLSVLRGCIEKMTREVNHLRSRVTAFKKDQETLKKAKEEFLTLDLSSLHDAKKLITGNKNLTELSEIIPRISEIAGTLNAMVEFDNNWMNVLPEGLEAQEEELKNLKEELQKKSVAFEKYKKEVKDNEEKLKAINEVFKAFHEMILGKTVELSDESIRIGNVILINRISKTDEEDEKHWESNKIALVAGIEALSRLKTTPQQNSSTSAQPNGKISTLKEGDKKESSSTTASNGVIHTAASSAQPPKRKLSTSEENNKKESSSNAGFEANKRLKVGQLNKQTFSGEYTYQTQKLPKKPVNITENPLGALLMACFSHNTAANN